MVYATRSDLEARFGAGEIAALAEDPDDEAADRTVAALADAAAVADGYLAVTYGLPLGAGPWPLLREIACDLARAALYDDASLEQPQKLMKRAVMKLEGLRDGKLNLVDAAGALAPRRNVAMRAGPAPVMTDRNLAGLAPGTFDDDCPPASGTAATGLDPSSSGGGSGGTPETDLGPSDPGGGTGPDIVLRAGWSGDATAEAEELTAESEDDTVVAPDASGGLHLVVWRSDAAGGDPSEVHIAGGGNSRNLFGAAAALRIDGVDGQAIVTVAPQNANLLSGEQMRVV